MPQPEAVNVRVGVAEEFGLNITRGLRSECPGSCNLQGQPGLDGQDVKGVIGVQVLAVRVQQSVFGIKEKMTFPDARGLAGVVKDIGLDKPAEIQADFIFVLTLAGQAGGQYQEKTQTENCRGG